MPEVQLAHGPEIPAWFRHLQKRLGDRPSARSSARSYSSAETPIGHWTFRRPSPQLTFRRPLSKRECAPERRQAARQGADHLGDNRQGERAPHPRAARSGGAFSFLPVAKRWGGGRLRLVEGYKARVAGVTRDPPTAGAVTPPPCSQRGLEAAYRVDDLRVGPAVHREAHMAAVELDLPVALALCSARAGRDRKSTRLNSSH